MQSQTDSREFTLRLPVKYRTRGEAGWHDGVTVNVTESGAVIEGARPPDDARAILVVISLPGASGCLTGRGQIVQDQRTPGHAADRARFAIAVPHYRIDRRSRVALRFDTLLQGC